MIQPCFSLGKDDFMYILFFLLWIIFNGQLTLEIALFGVVIAGLMYFFICKFMDFGVRKDVALIKETGYAVGYIGVLLLEIVRANMATIRLIMSSKYVIEPVLVHFKSDLKTRTAKTILANSITLTPGTITVSLEEDEFVIHCLDKDFAQGLENSSFVRLLRKMETVAVKELQKKDKNAEKGGVRQ